MRGLALNSTPPLPVQDLSTTVRARGHHEIPSANASVAVDLASHIFFLRSMIAHLLSQRHLSALRIDMEDPPLLEELYAPNTYRVVVTCIFLNKTRAVRAQPFLEAFFVQYPSPDTLVDADPKAIRERYFKTLGLFCRAWWLVRLASQLLNDPPLPHALRSKSYHGAGPASEVAHLPGVGEYASDAWRLFCRKDFYASYDEDVEEEWRTLDPKDKELKRYVRRKRREENMALMSAITTSMASVTLGSSPAGGTRVILRSGVRVRRISKVVATAS